MKHFNHMIFNLIYLYFNCEPYLTEMHKLPLIAATLPPNHL